MTLTSSLSIILLAHGMAEGGRIPLADEPNAGILLIGRTVATFMFFSVKGSTGCFYQQNTHIHKLSLTDAQITTTLFYFR